MFTTAVLLLVCGITLLAQIIFCTILLRLEAQWAKIPGVTAGRAFLATVVMLIGQSIAAVASSAYEPTSRGSAIILAVIALGCSIGLSVLVIQVVLRSSSWQAFRAWLPTLLVAAVGLSLVFLVIRPFLCQAFIASTNSMAPTILGNHLTGVCPTCGKLAFGTPPRDPQGLEERPMICESFHVHASKTASNLSHGDRFLVTKFLRPRRWDLVALRYPADPTIMYVKRLVGLPEEEVYIDEGFVWINGQRLEPPESLQGLTYVTRLPNTRFLPNIWGTLDHPAKLGEGEYFVLGDFSQESSDSRLWQTGAAGHPSYAVPESYLIGVVSHIYWPPSRWRILR